MSDQGKRDQGMIELKICRDKIIKLLDNRGFSLEERIDLLKANDIICQLIGKDVE